MTTFTSEDRQEAYKQKVEEAPYHPGYEDAVITPRSEPVYKGADPAKMVWTQKPLIDEEIWALWKIYYPDNYPTHLINFVRLIEERHGIK